MEKLALITGASRGIGRACALRLRADGWRIAVNYCRSQAEAAVLAEELGAGAVALRADVSDFGQVREMFEALEALGGADLLINNAGISSWGLLSELEPAEWRRVMAVNLDGAFYCSKLAIPGMVQRKSGKIINVSSVWGVAGASCEAAYSASKAALIGLTKALAKELGPSGIQVNCVAPGVIDTCMNRRFSDAELRALEEAAPLMRLGTPEDVAGTVAFLASPEADFITGQVLSPNGGFVI